MHGRDFYRAGFAGARKYARMFEKGDLKYVILDLLKDKPSHGYEIMRALEDCCHGLYTPSAGSIYPTLQLLEDMGYVKSLEQDGKRVYTILDEGRRFLLERRDTLSRIRGQMRDWGGAESEEARETARAFRDGFRDLADQMRRVHWNREKLAKVREVISRARQDIESILE